MTEEASLCLLLLLFMVMVHGKLCLAILSCRKLCARALGSWKYGFTWPFFVYNTTDIIKYRQKKIGTYMLVKTLIRLKEKGYKQATLSCVGDNARAIALYNRIGYKVIGHLLEMHWEI